MKSNNSNSVPFGLLAASILASVAILASFPARSADKSDEKNCWGITWSVTSKGAVYAKRNNTDIDRDPSADLDEEGNWSLKCIKHKEGVAHHAEAKDEETRRTLEGVCRKTDRIECRDAQGVLSDDITPGIYHCHVIRGSITCHSY